MTSSNSVGKTSTVMRAPRPVTPHGIITDKLAHLNALARTMPTLPTDLRTGLAELTQLAGGLDPYLSQSSTPQSAGLAALAAATQEADWDDLHVAGDTGLALEQEMLSGHIEGQFLKMLVHALRARRILEIGVFTGYSALAMAEALPVDGRLVACEIDRYAAQFARKAFDDTPQGARITIEVGPASETLARLVAAQASFELIFIDADKSGYAAYLDTILTGGLLAPHGLICVDNTLMQGQPYLPGEPTKNGQAIAAFNRRVAEDSRVEQVLIPLRDGLTLIRQV